MDHLNFLAFFCLTFKVTSVLGDKRLSTRCMYRYMSYFDLRTLHKCSYAFVTLFWDTLLNDNISDPNSLDICHFKNKDFYIATCASLCGRP